MFWNYYFLFSKANIHVGISTKDMSVHMSLEPRQTNKQTDSSSLALGIVLLLGNPCRFQAAPEAGNPQITGISPDTSRPLKY